MLRVACGDWGRCNMNPAPFWAIAYHSNSLGPRAVRWYRVSRMIEADDAVFELYWHTDFRGCNAANVRAAAKAAGVVLATGVYRDAGAPRRGNAMERAR